MSALSGVSRRNEQEHFSATARTETAVTAHGESARSGERAPRSPERRIGTLFAGRFRLTGLLGVGGMGVVYAAQDERSQRRVAIKLVRSGAKKRTTRGARLRREGRVAHRLQHPSIVRALGAGEFEGEPYVVLEHVSGARSLGELQSTLGLFEKVRVVRDAALALGYAHERGVVHRDVKPENILLDAQWRVRVVDFGLATTRDADRITEDGCCLGTPLFMAPETITAGTYGPQVDVWGLGVTLYWLLTARHPFEAFTITELTRLILTTRPTPPGRLVRGVPPRVERACLRALQRDPRKRHMNGAALAVELDRWLLGEWARQSAATARARRSKAKGGPDSGLHARVGLLLIALGALTAAAIVGGL